LIWLIWQFLSEKNEIKIFLEFLGASRHFDACSATSGPKKDETMERGQSTHLPQYY
jgi:hypothetical protein